jgi:hypothetical protein
MLHDLSSHIFLTSPMRDGSILRELICGDKLQSVPRTRSFYSASLVLILGYLLYRYIYRLVGIFKRKETVHRANFFEI